MRSDIAVGVLAPLRGAKANFNRSFAYPLVFGV